MNNDCDICLSVPCRPGCPNAPEPLVVCLCARCGDEIYVGDTVFDINDELWCEECIDDARTYAIEGENENDNDNQES